MQLARNFQILTASVARGGACVRAQKWNSRVTSLEGAEVRDGVVVRIGVFGILAISFQEEVSELSIEVGLISELTCFHLSRDFDS